MAQTKKCKLGFNNKTGKAYCLCTTSGGGKVFSPLSKCRSSASKAACKVGTIRYVKGAGPGHSQRRCFCMTKGGGAKFIDKSICKRKFGK